MFCGFRSRDTIYSIMDDLILWNETNNFVQRNGYCEVIENDYYWKNKEGQKLAIICEKNVKKKGLTRILDIDGTELELASLITKESDHFKII